MDKQNSKWMRLAAWAKRQRLMRLPVLALLAAGYALAAAGEALRTGAQKLKFWLHGPHLAQQLSAFALALVMLFSMMPLSLAQAGQTAGEDVAGIETPLNEETASETPEGESPEADASVFENAPTESAPTEETDADDMPSPEPDNGEGTPEDGSAPTTPDAPESTEPPASNAPEDENPASDLPDEEENTDSSSEPATPAEEDPALEPPAVPEEEPELPAEPEAGTVVTSFAPLDPSVAEQTYTVGTAEGDLALPTALDVFTQDSPDAAVPLAVANWTPEPAFDSATLGVYLFTPEFSDDVLFDVGVKIPHIQVTLEPASTTVTTWADLQDAVNNIDDGGIVYINNTGGGLNFGPNHEACEIPAGKTVTIKGIGTTTSSTIHRLSRQTGSFFNVLGTVIFENITVNGQRTRPASGALVSVAANGTLILKEGASLQNNASYGVNVASGAVFNLEGGDVSSNLSGVLLAGEMNLSSGSVAYNSTAAVINGLGISVDGGTLNMTGGSITGNNGLSDLSNGGGIYVAGNGTANISGGSIASNAAGYGGGICVNNGQLAITSGSITGNSAGQGGGLYVASGTHSISGITISGNKDSGSSSIVHLGGGISVVGAGTVLNLNNVQITGNAVSTTYSSGGGLAISDGAVVNLTNGSITGNSAIRAGQNVYVTEAASRLNLYGAPVVGNSSGGLYATDGNLVHLAEDMGSGFAIFLEADNASHFSMNFPYVTKNTEFSNAEFAAFTLLDSTSLGLFQMMLDNGGDPKAVVLFKMSEMTLQERIDYAPTGTADIPINIPVLPRDIAASDNSNAKTIRIYGGKYIRLFASEVSSYTRAGTFTDPSGVMFLVEDDSNLILEGLVLDGGGLSRAATGPIVKVEAGSTLTLRAGAVLQNNAARGIYSLGTVLMADGTIKGNSAPSILSEAGNADSAGGGIFVGEDSSFTMSGGNIGGSVDAAANQATMGGGMYVAAGASANISGGSITGNKANAAGGGIYAAAGATLALGSTSVSNNKLLPLNGGLLAATPQGGGIYVGTDASLTLGSTQVNNNSISGGAGLQTAQGAGIMVLGTAAMASGDVSSNSITGFKGAGAGVAVGAGGTFNMAGGQISANSASVSGSQGGGLYLQGAGASASIGGTSRLSANTAPAGGGVYAMGDATTTLLVNANAQISGNSAAQGGGAYINGAAFTLEGSAALTGNTGTGNGAQGAGAYVANGGSITATSNSLITGNSAAGSAASGGGVYVGDDGSLLLQGSAQLAGNQLTGAGSNGGGVYVAGSGAFLTSGGALSLGGSAKITGNSATGNGGGVYAAGGVVTIGGSAAMGGEGTLANKAAVGAELYNHSATLNLSGQPQIGGTSSGVYIYSSDYPFRVDGSITGAVVYMDPTGLSVTREIATRIGGSDFAPAEVTAFRVVPAGFYINNETDPKVVELIPARALTLQKRIDLAGGGNETTPIMVPVWADDAISGTVLIARSGGGTNSARHIRLKAAEGTSITYTRPQGFTGAMFQVPANSSLIMEGIVLDGGQVSGTEGAIIEVLSGGTLYLTAGNTLQNNHFSALKINGGGHAVMSGGSITGSSATNGGGVITTGLLEMSGGSIAGNEATNGGGVYVAGGGSLVHSGGSIGTATSPNTATNGGGVYVVNLYTMQGNALLVGNTATNGGGAFVPASGTMTVAGSAGINSNRAAYGTGGGVHNAGALTLTGGGFASNKATGNSSEHGGGAVYNSGTFTMASATLTDNLATGSYVAGATVYNTGTFKLNSGTITRGIADGIYAQGGGVHNTGIFEMRGGKLYLNKAAGAGARGGNVYVDGENARFTFSAGSVEGGIAETYGGGIYLAAGTTTISSTAEVDGNTAPNAAGIFVSNDANFAMSSGTVSNNEAATSGGGIMVSRGNGSFALTGGNIHSNKAPSGAGLVVAGGTGTTVGGVVIEYNVATGAGSGGGLLLIQGAKVTLDGTRLLGNLAQKGAGAYIEDGTLTLKGATVGGTGNAANKALKGGNGIYIPDGSLLVLDGASSFGGGNGFVAENAAAAPQVSAAGLVAGSVPIEAIPYATTAGVAVVSAHEQKRPALNENDLAAFTAPTGYKLRLNDGKSAIIAEPVVYTISYTNLEGSTHSNPATYTILSAAITLQKAANRDGGSTYHRFTHWTDTDASGATLTEIPAGSTGNRVVYANWMEQFRVTYNNNGGTGAPDSTLHDEDASFVLSTTEPSRTGYRFNGWNTAADGKGTAYAKGANIYNIGANLVLYAQWVEQVSLSFNANGADDGVNGAPTGLPGSQTLDKGDSVTLSTSPSWTGRNFIGWNTAADGSGTTTYTAGSSITVNGNTLLYAQWQGALTVTFHAQDSGDASLAGMPANTRHVTNLPYTLPSGAANTPTRTGQKFLGWATTSGATSAQFAPGANTGAATANLNFYAVWEERYQITYNANGGAAGSVPTDTTWYDNGGDVPIAQGEPTRTGYLFDGWAANAAGTGTRYKYGSSNNVFSGISASNATLYAQWIPAQTVSFNANAGSDDVSGIPAQPARVVTGDTYTIPSGIPLRSGYRFTGWNTAADASGAPYAAGDTTLAINNDITLYAQWVPRVTLSFDLTGGSGGSAFNSVPLDAGASHTLPSAIPDKAAYEFAGWNTAADGSGTAYAADGTISIAANTTLYAQWVGARKVILEPNDESSAPPTVLRVPTGKDASLAGKTPSRTTHRFDHWNTLQNGSGIHYEKDATIPNVIADITLYAQWKRTYQVQYLPNGGTGTPATQVKDEATAFDLSSALPTRTGHSFTGWNTDKDGNGTAYAPGQRLTTGLSADLTLWAQWEIDKYDLIYDANSGTGAPAAQQGISWNTLASVSTATPLRTGHTFTGWNTAQDGSGAAYAPGAAIRMLGHTTLYAQWRINKFTLTYNANGGTGEPSALQVNEFAAFSLSSAQPTREGHSFVGWNTAANGSGTAYVPGQLLAAGLSADLTLWAQWQVHRYELVYDANGGTGGPSALQDVAWGTQITVADTAPAREGYTFNNWNTAADGSGTPHTAGDLLTVAGNTTLYAQWSVNKFTLRYNANGGTGAPKKVSGIGWGTLLTLSEQKPTREGYTFTGWNTAKDGSGTLYKTKSEFRVRGNSTLYAQWRIKRYTLTYEANGGSKAPDKVTDIAWGSQVKLSTKVPTRSGYLFVGWNTEEDASGTFYMPGDRKLFKESLILYAIWTRAQTDTENPPSNPGGTGGNSDGGNTGGGGGTGSGSGDGSTSGDGNTGGTTSGPGADGAGTGAIGSGEGSSGGNAAGGSAGSGEIGGAGGTVGGAGTDTQAPTHPGGTADGTGPGGTTAPDGTGDGTNGDAAAAMTPAAMEAFFLANAIMGRTFEFAGLHNGAFEWDTDYFDVELEPDAGIYRFTPTHTGNTTVVYTDTEGVAHRYSVLVRDEGTPTSAAHGSTIFWVVFSIVAGIALLMLILILILRRRSRKKEAEMPIGGGGGGGS